MLQTLHIQNYALIDNLDIDFESGFSVITGETGAGKSILLGALALILGGRADSTAISPGAKRCIAEATFNLQDTNLKQFFEDNEIDFEDGECIIRRELTNTGKSRAFINDSPVALAIVKELSSRLIDIHSQHQNLLLTSDSFQLDIIDSVAGNKALLQEYQSDYANYRNCEREVRKLIEQIETNNNNTDYLQFQYNDISSANLADGEQEELEAEQKILDNAENIKEAVYNASNNISEVLEKLRSSHSSLDHISSVYTDAESYTERIESCRIELDDIASELTYKLSDIEFNPERAEQVNDRLNTIYSLQKKYHKETIHELLELQQELAEQLQSLSNSDELLAEKEKLCKELLKQAEKNAGKLSAARKEAAKTVEQQLVAQLQTLGMPNVVFSIEIKETDTLTPSGKDDICFLFSSNKNIPLRNIAKIASGGEIARVMLSLKALVSHHKTLPTIIFDEIDTGVSGKISEKMANVMSDMSQHGRQVICITHQPQIAACGQYHYRVFKEDINERTNTYIEQLSTDMRVEEIAKMLSGEKITEAAISNAKTLLKL